MTGASSFPASEPAPAREPAHAGHAGLMDDVYRFQRHIYDATRKYFLFGRDRMIAGLAARPGASVLEIGCGTGRNLAHVARTWPDAHLYGLDISSEMLKTAAARLGPNAMLAEGDACGFDAAALFGTASFDRVTISFALSMIPDWRAALAQAAALVAPGGSLHVVDFGDCAGLIGPLRAALARWLAHFHVSPRLDLAEAAEAVARKAGLACTALRGPFGYYRLVTLTRPI